MISLLWMLVFGVRWLRTSCRTLWLFWWAELFIFDVPSVRPGLGSPESPAQLTSGLNFFVCLPRRAKNIFFYQGMCHKGKVVGKHCWRGPGAPPWWSHTPELLPSHVLGSAINKEPGEGLAPGLALMPVEWTKAVAGLGQEREVFGQRPLQVTVWKGDLGEDLRERGRLRCLQV